MRWFSLPMIALLLVACSNARATDPASDHGVQDVAQNVDVFDAAFDGGMEGSSSEVPERDGGIDGIDAIDGTTVGHVCIAPDADMIGYGGACDGFGQANCQRWAQMRAGTLNAYGCCSADLHSLCLNGSYNGSACPCGVYPPCPQGFVCVSDTATSAPYCRCVFQ